MMDAHPHPRHVLPLHQLCICEPLRGLADLGGRIALDRHCLWADGSLTALPAQLP